MVAGTARVLVATTPPVEKRKRMGNHHRILPDPASSVGSSYSAFAGALKSVQRLLTDVLLDGVRDDPPDLVAGKASIEQVYRKALINKGEPNAPKGGCSENKN